MQSNFTSLLLYIVTFVLSSLLIHYGNKRSFKPVIILGLMLPVALASIRYMVGTDYSTYINIFNSVKYWSIHDFLHSNYLGIEPAYFVLIKLSYLIGNSPSVMFAFSSMLTVFLFYAGLVRYKLKHQSLIYLMYLFFVFPFTLNGIRQGIAMSIVFIAISYLIDKKLKYFFIYIAIASIFHISALFLLPICALAFISYKTVKKNIKTSLLKLFIVFCLSLFLLPIFVSFVLSLDVFNKYSIYQSVLVTGNNYSISLYILIMIVILSVYNKIITVDNKNLLYIYLAMFNIVFLTLGNTSDIFKRVSLYLAIYALILMTSLIDIFNDSLGKIFAYSSIVIFSVSYFISVYFLLGQSSIFPYRIISGGLLK